MCKVLYGYNKLSNTIESADIIKETPKTYRIINTSAAFKYVTSVSKDRTDIIIGTNKKEVIERVKDYLVNQLGDLLVECRKVERKMNEVDDMLDVHMAILLVAQKDSDN